MCGVPVERADDYLQRLIALGHRVAVCEQIEDPGGGEEARAEIGRAARRRAARHAGHDHRGAAARAGARQRAAGDPARCASRAGPSSGSPRVDISTGASSLSETDEAGLAPEIARLEPREIVAPQSLFDEPGFARLRRGDRDSPRRRSGAKPATPPRTSGASARSTASRRSTGSAPSPAPRSPPARWRSPMSSAPRSTQRPDLAPPSRGARSAHHGDRRGDARQSRADAHACRRAARLAARRPSTSPRPPPARGCSPSGWRAR